MSDVSDIYSALTRHDQNMVMRRNAVAGGATATVTLDAGAGATNSLYNDLAIAIVAGTGVGQTRAVVNYVGATKIATISPNWETTPVAGDSFILHTMRTEHSHIEDIFSLLSDFQSDFGSRVPKAVATNSQLLLTQSLASDAHSAAAQAN